MHDVYQPFSRSSRAAPCGNNYCLRITGGGAQCTGCTKVRAGTAATSVYGNGRGEKIQNTWAKPRNGCCMGQQQPGRQRVRQQPAAARGACGRRGLARRLHISSLSLCAFLSKPQTDEKEAVGSFLPRAPQRTLSSRLMFINV